MGHSKGSSKRKFIEMSAYIKNKKGSPINDVIQHLKLLGKKRTH
jgi:hypothetical protein